MSTMSDKNGLCLQVEESLAEVLEGSADSALYEHIADCDACRDLRHDAERAMEVVKRAAADFREPAGFADSLVAKIDAARPNGPISADGASARAQTSVAASREVKNDTQIEPVRSGATSVVITPARPSDLGKGIEKAESAADMGTA